MHQVHHQPPLISHLEPEPLWLWWRSDDEQSLHLAATFRQCFPVQMDAILKFHCCLVCGLQQCKEGCLTVASNSGDSHFSRRDQQAPARQVGPLMCHHRPHQSVTLQSHSSHPGLSVLISTAIPPIVCFGPRHQNISHKYFTKHPAVDSFQYCVNGKALPSQFHFPPARLIIGGSLR